MADGREQEQRLEVYPPVHRLGATGKWIRDQLLKGQDCAAYRTPTVIFFTVPMECGQLFEDNKELVYCTISV